MIKLSKKRKIGLGVLLLNSLIFLVLGCVFNIIVDAIIRKEVNTRLVLRKESFIYNLWVDPPVLVEFRIYAFDVINHEEVQEGRAVPFVVERGPYIYRMHLHKHDIVRHDDNSTISYRQRQRFIYDEKASVGSENDTFLSINIPFVTIATFAKNLPAVAKDALNIVMAAMKEKPFIRLSIHQIFWGYEDPVLEMAYKILSKFGIHMPMLNGKFGLFTGKNNSDDGLYNVFSGIDGNLNRYLHVDRWNGIRSLNIWTTPEANAIRGSTGSLYPPFVTSESKLTIFDAYLSRLLPLEYVKEISYKGIDALHFNVPYSDFDNAAANSINAGYCTPNMHYCIPSGAYNFSVVTNGAPVYVSLPHFCGADDYYFDRVQGLTPKSEDHQPYSYIHPMTGASLEAARRYQINIRADKMEHIRGLEKFPLTYLPIIWIDGVAKMNDKYIKVFRNQIQMFLDMMPIIRIVTFCISAILLLVALILLYCWWTKDNKADEEKPLLDASCNKNNNNKNNNNYSINGNEETLKPTISADKTDFYTNFVKA